MPTRSVTLTDHYDKFVSEQIASGKFRNASEVLRAGLGLLEQQMLEDRQKEKTLKELAEEGFRELDQGKGIRLGSKRELATFVNKLGQRATQKRKSRSKSA
jgi:antitoxin ParD1/3/4